MRLACLLLLLSVCTSFGWLPKGLGWCESIIVFPNDWNRPLLCGIRLSPGPLKSSVTHLGLIHLFVISGWHVQGLRNVLQGLGLGHRWQALIVTLAVYWTDLQPPAVRALFHGFVRSIKYWPSEHKILVTAILVLGAEPLWWHSVSFLLSWYATIWVTFLGSIKSPLQKHVMISLLIVPALAPISAVSFGSILVSYAILIQLTTVAIPIAILSGFIPGLANLLPIWEWQLRQAAQLTPPPTSVNIPLNWVLWLWLLIGLSHFGIWCFRRARCHG